MKYTPAQLDIIRARISDWRWRFANLYWINPAEKETPECLFCPRKEQWDILEAIYERGETMIAILKARQLGFSTLLALICLDMILFKAGFICGIVDQTASDAEKKMDKIKFAWSKLPDDIRNAYEVVADNNSELTIKRTNRSGSTVYAGMNARGGTHQLLWVSEWGPIQFDDSKRSDNIADGALPSAKAGIVVVETTWKGGKTGRLYTEVVEPAMKLAPEMRTKADWHIYFYAWWLDESYRFQGDPAQIDLDCRNYLQALQDTHGIILDDAQKLWYFKKAWVKRQKRFEEFPSHLAEIFMSPTEGAVYAEFMDKAMTAGRIIDFPPSKEPFYAFWDLGKRDLMVLTFIQIVGLQTRVFDCHMGRGGTLAEYARHCKRWEETYQTYIAGHFLPHDGGWERLGKTYNKSIAESLAECGLRNIQVVPRIPKLSIGLDYVRDRMASMVFHSTNLGRVFEFGTHRVSFLDSMNNYRYAPLTHNSAGREPVHDINSHACDSLRTYGEADERGLVPRSAGLREIDDGAESGETVSDFQFF